jgi:hypothetical protein
MLEFCTSAGRERKGKHLAYCEKLNVKKEFCGAVVILTEP